MAEADCGMCALMGYRSCDRCGTPVFDPVPGAVEDVCGYCEEGAPEPIDQVLVDVDQVLVDVPRQRRRTRRAAARSRR